MGVVLAYACVYLSFCSSVYPYGVFSLEVLMGELRAPLSALSYLREQVTAKIRNDSANALNCLLHYHSDLLAFACVYYCCPIYHIYCYFHPSFRKFLIAWPPIVPLSIPRLLSRRICQLLHYSSQVPISRSLLKFSQVCY
ncbi:unnamed protein product [Calicophoron daubneyi]|uniref:Uncharacterized protein n=1 Tax=Calicophoron daubneyi TaxID=300641 RepID=A0AAV2T4P8_CALDB